MPHAEVKDLDLARISRYKEKWKTTGPPPKRISACNVGRGMEKGILTRFGPMFQVERMGGASVDKLGADLLFQIISQRYECG